MIDILIDANHFGLSKKKINEHLKASLKKSHLGHEITLKNEYGQGNITMVEITDGIAMISYDLSLLDDFSLRVDTSVSNPLYFLYMTSGNLTMEFLTSGKKEILRQYQPMVISSTKVDPITFTFSKGTKTNLHILRLDRAVYVKNSKYHRDDQRLLNAIFSNPDPKKTFTFTCAPDLLIADIIARNHKKLISATLEPLLLEGAIRLFMGYIIDLYNQENKEIYAGANLTSDNMLRVQQVALEIKNNPSAPYSITALTDLTGLNPYKLQQAFKYLFKRTAADYIRNARLEQAESLLKKNNLNVSEVVLAVGLSSNSYFSKIFKQKYKYCPKAYQEKIKENRSEKGTMAIAG